MSTIRNILFVVYTTWLCLAVTFQFILLYFIMRHSPKNFRIFKWLLADSSMFQLVTIITCYFNQFGIITNVQPMLIETFGVCRHFEPRLCFFTYLTSVMSAILSNTAILATFYFKYRAVTKHVTTDSHVAKSLFMAHAPSALIFGLSVWFYQEMTPFFDQVSQNPQEFKKEESSIFAAISETSKAFPSISLALAFDAVWLPIVCGYFRRKVLQEVNMRMQRNSAIKRSQHSTFVTAWLSGEPRQDNGCGFARVGDGRWQSYDCTLYLPYVCVTPVIVTATCPPITTPSPTTFPTPPPCPVKTCVPSCDQGWTYFAPTNFCYRVFHQAKWDDAEASCVILGGHLASVHSELENTFINNIASCGMKEGHPEQLAWIGMHQVGQDWVWTDGTSSDYFNWAPKQPDHPGKELCVQTAPDLSYDKWYENWNNEECNTIMRAYVCKKASIQA
uniref:C-type lectin domain-containing protein n=1 Tax=Caenorhabditis japonica TaxID=281687 RepID=A0A8R1DJT9_CAEJA